MQCKRSASGTAVDIHAYAYYQDPIAQWYYMESGTALSGDAPLDPSFSSFSTVARHVGCGQPCGRECRDEEEHSKAQLDFMRQVSQMQITNFIGQYTESNTDHGLSFSVIPDNKVVFNFEGYTERSKQGKIAPVPSISSFTSNEALSLMPWSSDLPTKGTDQNKLNVANLYYTTGAALNSTAYRNRLQPEVPVFRFQYAAE